MGLRPSVGSRCFLRATAAGAVRSLGLGEGGHLLTCTGDPGLLRGESSSPPVAGKIAWAWRGVRRPPAVQGHHSSIQCLSAQICPPLPFIYKNFTLRAVFCRWPDVRVGVPSRGPAPPPPPDPAAGVTRPSPDAGGSCLLTSAPPQPTSLPS